MKDRIGVLADGGLIPLQLNDDGTTTLWMFNELGPVETVGGLNKTIRLRGPSTAAEQALLKCMAFIRDTSKKMEKTES